MAEKMRVLYVDDEPSLLEIGKRFLEKEGVFAVETLPSAVEALEQLTTEQYDAIISDYQMPGMDGITFLKQLKASGNTTPFIIFTGRGREEVVIEALNEGADFYIQKGGEPKSQFAELSHKIQSAVSRKRTEKLAKDTERQLYDIINFLPDATFAIDTEGKVIAWNRAIEEMTGVPAREMLAKGTFEYAIPFYGERRPILIDLVSIPDEELSRGRYAVVKKEGGVLIAETTLPRPLGKYSILLGKASLLYNEEGDVIGAIESIRDITKQKQAEEELRKSRDDYVGLLEHMTDVYYRSDTEGRLILASKSWAKYLGYDDLSECIGKNIAETFYADPGERKKFLEEIFRNGSVSDYEVSLKKKDGTSLPVATSSYLCFDDFGTVLGVEGTWRDITDRKRTEVALAESEEKYRTLVEKANEAIMIAQDDVFVFANKKMSELLGVPAGELEGRPFIDFIWPGDRELVMANYRKRLSGEAISDAYDFRIIGAGGRLTWAFLSAAAVQWKGRPATLNLVTDITDRKRTEEALRESEEKYRQIIATAHEGVWILDQDWCATFVNQHLEDMLGYQSGEILGKPLDFFIFEPDRVDHSQQRITRENGIAAKYERRFKKKDGSELWTLVSATPLFDNSGVFNGTFGMLTDITDRKRVEKALNESEEQSRMLLSQLPDIVMVHQEGIIVYANEMASDKTGYTHEELIGSHLFGYVVPDAREIIVRNMARRAAGEQVDDYEVDMVHKSGALHHIIVRTSPIVFNQVPSVVMILIDITSRKQAEKTLEDSENLYRTIFETTGAATIIIDNATTITRANAGFATLSGFLIDELEGKKSWTEFVVPEDLEQMKQYHQDRRNDPLGEARVYEFQFVNRSGEIRHCINNVSVIPGTTQSVASVVDITNRKLAEGELRLQTDAVEAAIDGLAILNAEQNYTYVNQAHARIYGYDNAHEIIGRSWRIFYESDELQRFEQEIMPELGQKGHYQGRARGKKKDGSTFPQEISLTVLENGGLICVVRDITESNRAEMALKESEEKYRDIFEHSVTGLFKTVPDGLIINANNAFACMYGYSSATEILRDRMNVGQFYANPEDRKDVLHILFEKGKVENIETPHLKRDGTRFWVSITARTICTTDGRVLFYEGTVIDITDRKRVEEALEKRLVALTQPLEDTETTFDELFNIDEIQRLQDEFANATGVASVITRTDGTPITKPSNFTRLCNDIIRKTSLGCTNCYKSDALIGRLHPDGPIVQPCLSGGLWDAGASIVVGGRHIASWLIGQVRNEAQTEESMQAYAREIGIEEQTVLEAFREVPSMSYTKFLAIAQSLYTLANQLSESAYQNVQQARFITERKVAEDALRESEEKFRATIGQSLDGILITDEDFRIIEWNTAQATIYGYTREEMLGRPLWEFQYATVPEENKSPLLLEKIKRSMLGLHVTSGSDWMHSHHDFVVQTRDGLRKTVQISTFPIVFRDRKFFGSISRDITGRKHAENALQEANKKLNLLSGITRHDINNQLTVLQGYLTILEDSPLDPDQKEYFQKVTNAAGRIAAMVRFAKGYEEIGVHAPIWQNCRTLVDNAAKQAPLGKVMVKNDLPAGAEVLADPLVVKVFYNLMDNAVRYGGKITTIRFSVKVRNSDHVVVCEDDGEGIDAAEKRKIFDRGFGKNTGLGLALSREILSITSITICETGEQGKGARFEMAVPKGMWRINGKSA